MTENSTGSFQKRQTAFSMPKSWMWIAGFHSFLCNSLQKELPVIRFNDVGLLGNVFSEVEGFTRQIQGKGEPVEWIPWSIGLHGQNEDSYRL